MIIQSLKAFPAQITMKVDADLTLKLICSGISVNPTNTLIVRKSQFVESILEPLAKSGVSINQLIRSSFLALTREYSINEQELEAWSFLLSKIEDEQIKLECSKFLSGILVRSHNMNPDAHKLIVKTMKQLRTFAKKQGDMEFYKDLNTDLELVEEKVQSYV